MLWRLRGSVKSVITGLGFVDEMERLGPVFAMNHPFPNLFAPLGGVTMFCGVWIVCQRESHRVLH